MDTPQETRKSHADLFELHTSGPDGFIADRTWVKDLQSKKIACWRCTAIYPDQRVNITQLVVNNPKSPPIHLGSAAWLSCGITLSRQLIDVLGHDTVKAWGSLHPIINTAGTTIDSQMLLLPERSMNGCIRGPEGPPPPSTCVSCGRLRYWPGPIQTERYLLHQYWEPAKQVLMLNETIICESAFWQKKIQPLKLKRLFAAKIKITDEPRDGLPADFHQMLQKLPKG
jgi:hypothetical protein